MCDVVSLAGALVLWSAAKYSLYPIGSGAGWLIGSAILCCFSLLHSSSLGYSYLCQMSCFSSIRVVFIIEVGFRYNICRLFLIPPLYLLYTSHAIPQLPPCFSLFTGGVALASELCRYRFFSDVALALVACLLAGRPLLQQGCHCTGIHFSILSRFWAVDQWRGGGCCQAASRPGCFKSVLLYCCSLVGNEAWLLEAEKHMVLTVTGSTSFITIRVRGKGSGIPTPRYFPPPYATWFGQCCSTKLCYEVNILIQYLRVMCLKMHLFQTFLIASVHWVCACTHHSFQRPGRTVTMGG